MKPRVTHLKKQKYFSAFDYGHGAASETSFEKRKEIYLEAIEMYPEVEWLKEHYNTFLKYSSPDFFKTFDKFSVADLIDYFNVLFSNAEDYNVIEIKIIIEPKPK